MREVSAAIPTQRRGGAENGSWPRVRLGEVCNINMGQSPESSTYNSSSEGLPFYQGNADFGTIHPKPRVWCSAPVKIAKAGDLLISVRAPIGALNFANERCCIGRGLAALSALPNVEYGFLYYALKSKVAELNAKGTGSTFKAINKRALSAISIVLPPLAIQRRIAAKLDRLCDIVAKRKNQLSQLNQLVKSRFVEMFGDLARNQNQWGIVAFDDVAEIEGGLTTDFEKYSNCPHIGIDSIEKDTGTLKGYRTVSEDKLSSGKYHFTARHIIYSKIRPNLNKVALPAVEGLCSADAYAILPKKNVERIFLAFVLRSRCFLDYIIPLSGRSGMPKANQVQVRGFQFPLPPLALQREFAAFVEKVDKLAFAVRESLESAEKLYRQQLSEAFA